MKKKVFGRKLGRERDTRRALFRSLIRSLVERGAIATTKAKAKSILPTLEKLVTKAKSGEVSSKRWVYSFLGNDRTTADNLFGQIAKNFSAKNSGFIRVVNLPRRYGDNAEMVRMEWTEKMEVGGGKLEVGKKTKGKKESETVQAEAVKKKQGLKSKVASLLKSEKK